MIHTDPSALQTISVPATQPRSDQVEVTNAMRCPSCDHCGCATCRDCGGLLPPPSLVGLASSRIVALWSSSPSLPVKLTRRQEYQLHSNGVALTTAAIFPPGPGENSQIWPTDLGEITLKVFVSTSTRCMRTKAGCSSYSRASSPNSRSILSVCSSKRNVMDSPSGSHCMALRPRGVGISPTTSVSACALSFVLDSCGSLHGRSGTASV